MKGTSGFRGILMSSEDNGFVSYCTKGASMQMKASLCNFCKINAILVDE